MSTRALIRMTEDEVCDFLKQHARAHIATISKGGGAHLVPVHYVLLHGLVTFWTDIKSQKAVNLHRDPRITCLVEDGATFQELRAVSLSGSAAVLEDHSLSVEVAERMLSKHPLATEEDRDRLHRLAVERAVVVIRPDRVISWDHRKLTGATAQGLGR